MERVDDRGTIAKSFAMVRIDKIVTLGDNCCEKFQNVLIGNKRSEHIVMD